MVMYKRKPKPSFDGVFVAHGYRPVARTVSKPLPPFNFYPTPEERRKFIEDCEKYFGGGSK